MKNLLAAIAALLVSVAAVCGTAIYISDQWCQVVRERQEVIPGGAFKVLDQAKPVLPEME